MNFDGPQISMELNDLLCCLEQQKLEQPQRSNLIARCFNNSRQIRRYQFKDKFTDRFPQLPMRRESCCACLTQSVTCSECKYLGSSPCCQQMQECVYDYQEWSRHKEDSRYKICYNCRRDLPNSRFSIDWRLIRLVEKIGGRSAQSKYFMNVVGSFLWLTKDNQLSYQKGKTIKTPSIFYQDHFGMYFCPTNDPKYNLKQLGEYNSKCLESLLKQNAKLAVELKQEWEESNLEQQCQQIIEKIAENQQMQHLKSQLQSTQDYNEYTHCPSSRETKYIDIKYINNKHAFNSEILQKQDQYSHNSNQHIMFCFLWQYGVLLIKNANYETSPDFNNIRPIPIQLNAKINMNWQIMKTAVWFKDRRGDIFSFAGASLCIYKYHLLENLFHQILIKEDQTFRQVIRQRQLLYIPQTDRVYYFNAAAFHKSFYIELLRNQKVNYSCERVNIIKDSFTNCLQFPPLSNSYYSLYTIQTVTLEREGIKRKQCVIIIYFLFYKKQSMLSLPLGIRRLIHFNNRKQSVCLLQNIAVQQSSYLHKRKLDNFDQGLFFSLSMHESLKLFFYTVLEGKTTLIEINVGSNIKIKEEKGNWNIVSQKIVWNHKYLQFSPKYNTPAIQQSKNYDLYKSSLLINDAAGTNNNNSIRYLGHQNTTRQIVQFMITNQQGRLQWKLYQ